MEPVETAVDRLQKELDRLLPRNSNNAKVEINAGGVGVWIASTACAIMVAVSLMLGMWVLALSAKVDRLEDYLAAIYAQAPHLKPEDDNGRTEKN